MADIPCKTAYMPARNRIVVTINEARAAASAPADVQTDPYRLGLYLEALLKEVSRQIEETPPDAPIVSYDGISVSSLEWRPGDSVEVRLSGGVGRT